MREYETVYIFRPALEREEVEGVLDRFHERLAGAEIGTVEHWGKRRLAYDIDGERNGYYVVARFRAEPSVLSDYERALRMEEDLIRYLLVLSEGELPVPASAGEDEPGETTDGDGAEPEEDEPEEDEPEDSESGEEGPEEDEEEEEADGAEPEEDEAEEDEVEEDEADEEEER